MNIGILGAGLMGSQIGVEYAVGGHDVTFVTRSPESARQRVEHAFTLAEGSGLASSPEVVAARGRTVVTSEIAAIGGDCAVVVENVVEDLGVKGGVLAEAATAAPDAILATNTSSLSILAIGAACGAPERVVGTHYWNPPLLMPLVEVIRSERTRPGIVEKMTATLRALGKRPVPVEKDVPGFVWNRMQMALLREAVWIVEHGVASPEAVDEIVRDGLARRWRHTGPFQTAALGGAETFERVAANLWPEISAATELRDLRRWLPTDGRDLAGVRERRDRGLRGDLAADRMARAGALAAASGTAAAVAAGTTGPETGAAGGGQP